MTVKEGLTLEEDECSVYRLAGTYVSGYPMFHTHHEWRLCYEGWQKGWQRRFYCIFCRAIREDK